LILFVYNELLGGPRAMLLYPATSTSFPADGTYAMKQHTCEQRHLGLSEGGTWSSPAIKEQLSHLLWHLVVDARSAAPE